MSHDDHKIVWDLSLGKFVYVSRCMIIKQNLDFNKNEEIKENLRISI